MVHHLLYHCPQVSFNPMQETLFPRAEPCSNQDRLLLLVTFDKYLKALLTLPRTHYSARRIYHLVTRRCLLYSAWRRQSVQLRSKRAKRSTLIIGTRESGSIIRSFLVLIACSGVFCFQKQTSITVVTTTVAFWSGPNGYKIRVAWRCTKCSVFKSVICLVRNFCA